MKSSIALAIVSLLAGMASLSFAQSNPKAPPPLPVSKVQPVLDASAKDGKFTFIVFSKGDSPASRTMVQTVKNGVATRSQQATFTTADANAAGEQSLVEKFGVSRAPMPITVAVAPNGAVTGLFSKEIQDEHLTASIVPPTMMRCMKSLQEQKLVFVCLTRDAAKTATAPAGVQTLQKDPDFKNRIELISMQVDDPQESRLLEQMKIDPAQVSGPYAVLLAPPGVLIGHYGAKSSPEEIAAAIHHAGKCCDDANCKHNRAAPSTSATPKSTIRRK